MLQHLDTWLLGHVTAPAINEVCAQRNTYLFSLNPALVLLLWLLLRDAFYVLPEPTPLFSRVYMVQPQRTFCDLREPLSGKVSGIKIRKFEESSELIKNVLQVESSVEKNGNFENQGSPSDDVRLIISACQECQREKTV